MSKSRVKTRAASWVERQAYRSKIGDAIEQALAQRMAEMPRFQSEAMNRLFQPTADEVTKDAMAALYGRDAAGQHTQRLQLESAIKARLTGDRMGYGSGLDSFTGSALVDAGYGDAGDIGLGLEEYQQPGPIQLGLMQAMPAEW